MVGVGEKGGNSAVNTEGGSSVVQHAVELITLDNSIYEETFHRKWPILSENEKIFAQQWFNIHDNAKARLLHQIWIDINSKNKF